MEEERSSKKTKVIIGIVILLLILLGIGLYFFLKKTPGDAGGVKSLGSLFGVSGDSSPRENSRISPNNDTEKSGSENTGEEPLFRQLANIPVAGATSVVRDGKTYVRYVSREKGNVFEVDPVTGETTQLTNTTIPRVYEALWGNQGNSVVLRYLVHDPLSRQDVIKTYFANIVMPASLDNGASSTDPSGVGSLKGSFLADDIASVSISPNGTHLFFLLPIAEGVSGSIVDLSTLGTKEVLRSTFSEWQPELLDSGFIILTTKPSAKVAGFSYVYNPISKTFSRLLREKKALTTKPDPRGDKVIYGENVSNNYMLGLYDAKGFISDEGEVTHTAALSLVTLPEKCAWSKNTIRVFCGAFNSPGKAEVPDEWYQGVLSFSDTFWTINTDSSEVVLLADPTKERSAMRSFDVLEPFIGGDEKHLFFIDKNDATLWSMRIIKEKFNGENEDASVATDTPMLTPEELRDAEGSSVVIPPGGVRRR